MGPPESLVSEKPLLAVLFYSIYGGFASIFCKGEGRMRRKERFFRQNQKFILHLPFRSAKITKLFPA
jgi:hypothetical protein